MGSYSDSFGQSTHSLPVAQRAQQNGANYVFVGSVFPTQSHPGEDSVGTNILKEYNLSLDIPFVGIGGIDASNAADVIKVGAHGVAVISAILATDDPKIAATQLMDAMLNEAG